MTLRIMIVNAPDIPTDTIIEVSRLPLDDSKGSFVTHLWPGQSMEGFISDGAEYHIREAAIPPAEAPEETKPQQD